MTWMMKQLGNRRDSSRFTTAARLSLLQRRTRRIKNMAAIPVEVFHPIALLSALAIYLFIVSSVGGGSGGAP